MRQVYLFDTKWSENLPELTSVADEIAINQGTL